MSSSEDFKILIESFLQKFTTHIADNEILQQFETDYNSMMDQCTLDNIIKLIKFS